MKLDIELFLLLIAVLMSFWKLRKDTDNTVRQFLELHKT